MFPQVKPDPDASTPYIKPDPDNKDTVLADVDDEDLYEDAGDLDFANATQSLWLSRIPRSLWEHWSKLDDDEEIQIGTIRIEGEANDIKRVSQALPYLFPKFRTSANRVGRRRSACA
jgi:transcription initiation factor TFIIF subunit beta